MYQKDSNTVALLHFDNDFSDECGNVWTSVGNVQVDSSQKRFGNKSLYIPANSYLLSNSNTYAFAGNDFTVEFWVYSTTPNSAQFTSSCIIEGAKGVAMCGDVISYGNNSAHDTLFPMPGITPNVWTHLSVVRKGTQFFFFLQGQLVKQVTVSSPITSTKFAIGARYGDGMYPTQVPIYIDEFRISNIARWTQSFTPGVSVSAPTNLHATAGDAIVNLSWDGVIDATSYNIKRAVTPGGVYEVIANNVIGNNYSDSNVVNGTTYYYVVTATDASGESANSNEASATPVISTPLNLTVVAGDTQVSLSWDIVTGATGYSVRRSKFAGGPYSLIASNVSTNGYVDTNVTNGTPYYYVVSSVDADSESSNSNEVSATPVDEPIPDEQAFLTVTMIDSSEREFQLTVTEIEGFISWFNNHISGDSASYMLNKNVGLRNSKGYLAFDKIISFEVTPVAE